MWLPARPLGSDLTAALVEVRVDRLDQQTFYATVVVDGPQGPAEVDARPSDTLTSPWWSECRSGWTLVCLTGRWPTSQMCPCRHCQYPGAGASGLLGR